MPISSLNSQGKNPTPFTTLVATGGSVFEYSQNQQTFRSHTFTSTSTFAVISGTNSVDYLIVAGGGGGGGAGHSGGGGGGAGGYIQGTFSSISPGNYTVTVGAGGSGATGDRGQNGGNSVFNNLTAIGVEVGEIIKDQTHQREDLVEVERIVVFLVVLEQQDKDIKEETVLVEVITQVQAEVVLVTQP